jgi:hypothetical protein
MAAPESTFFGAPKWMENVAAFVFVSITAMEIFLTVAPYFGMTPSSTDQTLTAQQQSIMNNVFISIVAFLVGASAASRAKDATIAATVAAQATTIAKAQDALPPVPGATPTVSVPTGEAVTVKATEPKP